MAPSMAAALRFLKANDGKVFTTDQVTAQGRWQPGPRALSVRGTRFCFVTPEKESWLNLSGDKVEALTDTSVTFVNVDFGSRVTYALYESGEQ